MTIIRELLRLCPVAALATLSWTHVARPPAATRSQEISHEGEPTRTDAPNRAALIQGFPSKPVRLIEPFGAGGGPDLIARALAQELSELWGQPVTVENVPGAGATAGESGGPSQKDLKISTGPCRIGAAAFVGGVSGRARGAPPDTRR